MPPHYYSKLCFAMVISLLLAGCESVPFEGSYSERLALADEEAASPLVPDALMINNQRALKQSYQREGRNSLRLGNIPTPWNADPFTDNNDKQLKSMHPPKPSPPSEIPLPF